MKSALPIAAMLVLAAAFTALPAQAYADVSITIGSAPPPPRFEYFPPARDGFVWIPGFWGWESQHHVWLPGHWEGARAGHVYHRALWVREGAHWRLVPAYWEPIAGAVAGRVDEARMIPPPPRYEPMPHPRHGHVWSPGHWEWRGGRFEWVTGFWVAERPGYVYAPPVWVQREGRWFLDEPRWARRGHDRDHDGIPNAYDRDRDGDGVPNRHDRHPDNPRRD